MFPNVSRITQFSIAHRAAVGPAVHRLRRVRALEGQRAVDHSDAVEQNRHASPVAAAQDPRSGVVQAHPPGQAGRAQVVPPAVRHVR